MPWEMSAKDPPLLPKIKWITELGWVEELVFQWLLALLEQSAWHSRESGVDYSIAQLPCNLRILLGATG